MSATTGTIGVRGVVGSRHVFRALLLIAAIVLSIVATARILAADRVTEDTTLIQPVGSATSDERRPHGFGRSDADQPAEAGVRNPLRIPKS
jgi:hypothetical protein